MYYLIVSMGQKCWHSLTGSFAYGLAELISRYVIQAIFSSEDSAGEELFSNSLGLLAEFISLWLWD